MSEKTWTWRIQEYHGAKNKPDLLEKLNSDLRSSSISDHTDLCEITDLSFNGNSGATVVFSKPAPPEGVMIKYTMDKSFHGLTVLADNPPTNVEYVTFQ